VVCLLYHGGDWDALDDAIQQADKHHGEEKWSHLRDLTERLDRADLTAADLVGATPREPKLSRPSLRSLTLNLATALGHQ